MSKILEIIRNNYNRYLRLFLIIIIIIIKIIIIILTTTIIIITTIIAIAMDYMK